MAAPCPSWAGIVLLLKAVAIQALLCGLGVQGPGQDVTSSPSCSGNGLGAGGGRRLSEAAPEPEQGCPELHSGCSARSWGSAIFNRAR